jgi:hypothetical protein
VPAVGALVRTEVTLHVVRDPGSDAPASKVIDALFALGGWMTSWKPDGLHHFGAATFVFADERTSRHFVRAALQVHGVYPALWIAESKASDKSFIAEASDALPRATPSTGQTELPA